MISGHLRKIAAVFLPVVSLGFASAAQSAEANDVDASVQGPDEMAACQTGTNKTSVLISVKGVITDEGNVRVQVYDDNPDDFLASGKKLMRVDVPTLADEMDICVILPGPGTYAFVVMHDKNANGKADFFTEGFGFSNNPKLVLSAPDFKEVAFGVKEGAQKMEISLTYMFHSAEDKSKKRRRRR